MSPSVSVASGQPPLHVRKARSFSSNSFFPSICSGAVKSSRKLTDPFDSPDSQRLIVRIVSHAKRPVPVCRILSVAGGTAEPVSMKCPYPSRWSTANLTASHSCGATCHSSISRGESPSNRIFEFILAIRMFCSTSSGFPIYKTLAACRSAVVVFPHHFGPSISTAPFPLSLRSNNVSAILFLYCPIYSLSFRRKNSKNFSIRMLEEKSFGCLRKNHSDV